MLEIRPITSTLDLPACAAVLVEAYNAPPWNDQWTTEKALEKLTCFYHSPKFLGWQAFWNGNLVGCCVGNIEPYFSGDYFYLKEMFVLPQEQRGRVGTVLLTTLRDGLATIDITTIILFTSKDNFPWNFYLKHGFGEMEGMRMMMWNAGEEG